MTKISDLEISLVVGFLISMILIARKALNRKSFKYASKILWGIVFLRLIFPYSILIPIDKVNATGITGKINSLIINFNQFKSVYLLDTINNLFPKINRFIIVIFIGAYVLFKIFKTVKSLSRSVVIENDKYIDDFLKKNKLKRKVQVLVNDDLKYPITYGVINPKIIIQSRLIGDKETLRYVLNHEIIHIKKFDVVWKHLKCILICIYWYNPLVWVMGIYLNKDIEVLCDKLVIQKTGDNEKNKKDYCLSMLNLISKQENNSILGLNLHPSMERMIILKNWRVKKWGIVLGIAMICITSLGFVSAEENVMPTTVANINVEEKIINLDSRTKEITLEEYKEIDKKSTDNTITPMKANINDSTTIRAFGNKSYTFDMGSWTSASHQRFVTKISNVSSKGSIDFKVLIEENGEIIYSKSYDRDIILTTTNAKDNREYKVTIINNSNADLSYDVSIVSYLK